MYQGLIDLLLILDVVSKSLIGLGWLFGIFGVVLFIIFLFNLDDGFRKSLFIPSITLIVLTVGILVVAHSNFIKPEWQIARAVAKQVDSHVVENPDSTFNPNQLIGHADAAVLGVFTVLKDAPANIQKLISGKSMSEIIAEREAKEREAEFQEFLRFREQNK